MENLTLLLLSVKTLRDLQNVFPGLGVLLTQPKPVTGMPNTITTFPKNSAVTYRAAADAVTPLQFSWGNFPCRLQFGVLSRELLTLFTVCINIERPIDRGLNGGANSVSGHHLGTIFGGLSP